MNGAGDAMKCEVEGVFPVGMCEAERCLGVLTARELVLNKAIQSKNNYDV